MPNTYFSSTLLSLKSKGSFSFSFNDYSSLLNDRFDRTSSSSSSCSCCCCAFSTHNRLPVNPSYLYGLRQSTLIQCSPSRRLILGGGDRYFCRFPVYDRGIYEVSCSIKKTKDNGALDRRRKGRFRCMGLEEKSESESYRYGDFNDAEAVISFLSEEFSEEYLVDTKRNEKLAKRVEVEKRNDRGREFYRGKKNKAEVAKREDCAHGFYRGEKNKVQVEKRENYGGDCSKRRKKNVGLDLLESDSKCEFDSTIESREERYRRNEENKSIIRDENRRGRPKSSSSSSYHSLASFEEYESGKEGEFVEESLSGFKKDSSRDEADRFKAEVKKEFGRYSDDAEGHGEVLEQKYAGAGSRVEWDCRKSSEKKLTEVETEETQSIKKSSEIRLGRDRMRETDYAKASSSRKQFSDVEKKSSLEVNLDMETKKQYNQMGIQDTTQSESRWKCEEVTNTAETHGSDIETTSQSKKQFSGREGNLRRGEHHQTIARNDDLRTNLQQGSRTSEILDINTERISDKSSIVQSETRMKNQEEHTRLVSISYPEVKGQQSQTDHKHHERTQSRKGSQDSTSLSVHASDMKIYTESERTAGQRITNQESTLTSVVKPIGEKRGRHNQTDEKVTQTTSQKEAQKPTRLSSFVKSPEESSSLQSSSNLLSQAGVQQIYVEEEEEERNSQAILMPPPSQLVTRGSLHVDQTSGIAVQEFSSKSSESGSTIFYTHSGGRTPDLRDESYGRGRWGEASDEPLDLITPEDALGSAQRLEESSMQFVGEFVEKARHEVSTSELQKKKKAVEAKVIYEGEKQWQKNSGQYGSEEFQLEGRDSRQSSESSGAKGPLDLISHEDALDSAHRFEESSMHFVGEFAEKARHGVSTSEMQKEKEASEVKVVSEGEKQQQKNSGQYGSEDFQLKRRESKRSSESSGVKGPSDEMWDVTGPSVQPLETEALKGNIALGTAIVKKSGRTLWSIMADIVRLRWGPRAETSTSAARSDGKDSSNESISSETLFSGHEYDKNSDENVKRERRSMVQQATPSLQPKLRKTSTQTQGEASDPVRSMSKVRQLEADMPSSSKGISSNFGEENISQIADGKSFQGTASGIEIVPSSSTLPATIIRRPPIVEGISKTGPTKMSESGSMEQQVLSSVRLTEASGSAGKDGELKQRKLQRKKQVSKDRFEEWEEAYILESEQRTIDEIFMREALLEAKKAADTWEVPVGAVLVQHGKIIARGCNLVEGLRDSTAHAEMICIREASNVLRTWRLAETTLYVTLEPCPMCAGAILQARIPNLVWGAPNKLLGADGSWVRLFPGGREGGDGSEPSDKPPAPAHPFHPKMTIRRGVLATECADVMRQFFQLRRRKEKNEDPTPPPSSLPIANHPSKILTKMQNLFHLTFCL